MPFFLVIVIVNDVIVNYPTLPPCTKSEVNRTMGIFSSTGHIFEILLALPSH